MNLDDLSAQSTIDLAGVKSVADLETFRIRYLGTKGQLKDAADFLRTIPGPDKRAFGQRMNEVKKQIEAAFEEKKAALAAGGGGAAAVVGVDVTEPGRLSFEKYQPGVAHIITQTIDRLTELFARMGFSVAEGPEVEDDFHNFEALNIPRSHPARDPLDNFYLDRAAGAAPFMLRSQTSSVQIRVMETQKPPIRVVVPGRVYRPDTVDATHLFQFHQIEALVVDKGITMVDLRSTIDQFAKAFFGPTVETRFRPSFFPFTEPSAEVDVLVPQPDGSSKWMEIGGCGMVDPNVFKAVNIDPDVYTGWAFGFGIERLAMRRHNITDIRDLVANDLRFLRQF
jgi:phenylalanyl-tRNA synthetase alpha chain